MALNKQMPKIWLMMLPNSHYSHHSDKKTDPTKQTKQESNKKNKIEQKCELNNLWICVTACLGGLSLQTIASMGGSG